MLLAGQDILSQQDISLLVSSKSSKCMGLLCQNPALWLGPWTSVLAALPTPASLQSITPMFLKYPHYWTGSSCISTSVLKPGWSLTALPLLSFDLPLIPALKPNLDVHPSQFQATRGVFSWALYPGNSHPEPPSDPSSSLIFTLRSPSLASHELQMEEIVVCMCVPVHAQFLSGLFLSNPLGHPLPVDSQRAVTRD